MSKVIFKTEIDGKEIGFVDIVPDGDYQKFLKARRNINKNDCCAITNKPLDADNGFFLTIMKNSRMPNCFVNKKAVEEIGFQTSVEAVVENWKKAHELRHWFE